MENVLSCQPAMGPVEPLGRRWHNAVRNGTCTLPLLPPKATLPKRFHGTVTLDAARVGRDAGRIADEVISHLVGLVSSNVKVTLEVEAEVPSGVPDSVVRTVTENSRTLKFTNQGFERERPGANAAA